MKRALVVGAGATGKAAALALANIGHPVTIFDPNDQPGTAGGALMLWSNAITALDKLGVTCTDLLAQKAIAMQRMDFRTWEGDLLWSMAINELSAHAKAPSLLVDRRSLQSVLDEKLKGKVDPPLKKTFWNFRDHSTGVEAVFTDGTKATGDILLGAEGGESKVRTRLFGPPRYRTTKQYVASGYSRHASQIAPVGACYCLMDSHHRFFAAGLPSWWDDNSDDKPDDKVRTYWGASVPTALAQEKDPGCISHNRPFSLAKLCDAFAGAAPEVDEVLAGSADDACHPPRWWAVESRDLPPGRPWYRGRVGLLGDAAHLMTYDLGQGQAMGLEDAVVLGRSLSKHPDNPSAALAAWQSARQYRVGVITELSYRAAQISTPGSELLSWLRDLATANFYAPINERTMRYMLEPDLGGGAYGAAPP
jgi:2-polyprenyl-6-methoxyphenol hydroxylase-like FAD-dependent oxidoreductase